MKVTLEFELPEEEVEMRQAIDAKDYLVVLREMANFLRNKIKYEDLSDAEYTVYNEVRDLLFFNLDSYNIDLYGE